MLNSPSFCFARRGAVLVLALSAGSACAHTQNDQKVYTNKELGFQLRYPASIRVVPKVDDSYFQSANTWSQLLQAGKPEGLFVIALAGSNSSYLRIGSRPGASKDEACGSKDSSLPWKTEAINGHVFEKAEQSDAGMSHYLSVNHHHIFHRGHCLVFERVLTGTACDVYDGQEKAECKAQREKDQKTDTLLQGVMKTFETIGKKP